MDLISGAVGGGRGSGSLPTTVVSERGATAVEYALLLSLIFVAVVGAVSLLGSEVVDLFTADWPW